MRQITVTYGDLDLGTLTDARVMLTRLEQAAKRACGGDPRLNPDYNLTFQSLEKTYQECRSDAVARAVVEVNAALLTELFGSEGTQRLASAAEG